jgi:hypothetical protein
MKKNNKSYMIILAFNHQVNKMIASMITKNDQLYLIRLYMGK